MCHIMIKVLKQNCSAIWFYVLHDIKPHEAWITISIIRFVDNTEVYTKLQLET